MARGTSMLVILREHARANANGLPFGVVTRITRSICDALPDSHRDLAPSSTFLLDDGTVELGALEGEGYLSPEQVKGQPLDHRTDIFSLGTMVWEMLVGKRLFKRDTDMQMLYAILEEPITKPSERNDKIPPAVDDIVMRALAREPDARYQTARELADDLDAVARTHAWDTEQTTLARFVRALVPAEPPPAPAPERAEPAPTPTGNRLVIAILVAVLVGSLGFWLLLAPIL